MLLRHASPPPSSTHAMIPHNLFFEPSPSTPTTSTTTTTPSCSPSTQPPPPPQTQQTTQKRKRQTELKFRTTKRTKPTPLIRTLVKNRFGTRHKKESVESSVAPAEGGVSPQTIDTPSDTLLTPPTPLVLSDTRSSDTPSLTRSTTTLTSPSKPQQEQQQQQQQQQQEPSSPQTHLKSQRKALLKSLTQTVQTLSKSLGKPKQHFKKSQRRDVLVRRKRMLEWVRRVDT
ncbi:uncharacterized protein SPPG_07672 [Spizellomyces punctatus DAOM BR117]|uniref:Uncharacterized protein n=1 Tax=Spizellomyces punctatus (strain DAOM BR117) TaxID=645134 RepID=A0A0L0H810_SPIPD|nr:uncharacterized protein SPPG_07672 [Spizellomyces punctatus DAOM BR117]KNC96838.1 hypothetical protein SPPG_07672 [Spizellomyces punctatus DAOM BR117]|eukprot:XP_016604878.1 hypothetical protein SPPG_07672 [Spizellomyces punctatus DAOM BR117]